MREKRAGVLQEEYAKPHDICSPVSLRGSNMITAGNVERRPLSASSLRLHPRRCSFRTPQLQHRQVLHQGAQRSVRVALIDRLQDLLDQTIGESRC